MYTAEGLLFSQQNGPIPKFQIGKLIDCNHGTQDQDFCICDKEYQGEACDQCKAGYFYNLKGECLVDSSLASALPSLYEKTEPRNYFTYIIAYALVLGIVLLAIHSLRRKKEPESGFELTGQQEISDSDINLYDR